MRQRLEPLWRAVRRAAGQVPERDLLPLLALVVLLVSMLLSLLGQSHGIVSSISKSV